jgi:hypothetical protein
MSDTVWIKHAETGGVVEVPRDALAMYRQSGWDVLTDEEIAEREKAAADEAAAAEWAMQEQAAAALAAAEPPTAAEIEPPPAETAMQMPPPDDIGTPAPRQPLKENG